MSAMFGGGLASWKTRDIAVAAAVAVVLGILYQLWGLVWGVLNPIMGPIGGDLLNGLWYLAAILVPYIIRKPGAALFGQLVAALVEMVAGGLWGVDLIISGLVMGAGAELVFFLTRYQSYSLPVLLLAGLAAHIPEFIHAYVVYGYTKLTPFVVLAKFVVSLISVFVLASFLGKVVGYALARTGVLSGFAVGRGSGEEV